MRFTGNDAVGLPCGKPIGDDSDVFSVRLRSRRRAATIGRGDRCQSDQAVRRLSNLGVGFPRSVKTRNQRETNERIFLCKSGLALDCRS